MGSSPGARAARGGYYLSILKTYTLMRSGADGGARKEAREWMRRAGGCGFAGYDVYRGGRKRGGWVSADS